MTRGRARPAPMCSLPSRRVLGLLAVALLIAAPGGVAQAQAVDLARSSIKVVARQMNVPFEGQFTSFKATLAWDDANPANSRASVDVDLASFDLGEPGFNDEARGKAFLNAAVVPRATFVSSAVRSLGGGRYEATGRLGIKGITREVSVPFTLREEGGARVFDARFVLKRLDFRIGEGEWADTKTLADETQVQVRLVLLPARR